MPVPPSTHPPKIIKISFLFICSNMLLYIIYIFYILQPHTIYINVLHVYNLHSNFSMFRTLQMDTIFIPCVLDSILASTCNVFIYHM